MPNIGVGLSDVRAQTINIHDIKVGSTAEELVAVLEARGMLAASDLAGLQRRTIIGLAHRLKPDVPDFEQAVTELERAVEVALDVIARGERGTNDDVFVDAVLARVAEKVRNDDLDGSVREIDEALAELAAKHQRLQIALLEEGVRVHTLRRDAVAVARCIEMIVAAGHPIDKPAWSSEFRARYDEFITDGSEKGINFSLLVAVELARRMAATARDGYERSYARNLFGFALWNLGERNSGTERLEEAVSAYRAALEETTRERVPLDWAMTQNNLGNALSRLGERESGTARLEKAVAAYRAALEEWTRERVPLNWTMTQNNLGLVLWTLGARGSGTARLEEAVAAWDARLSLAASIWPPERVRRARTRRDEMLAEIARRSRK